MKFRINILIFYSLLLTIFYPLASHAKDSDYYKTHSVQAYWGGAVQMQQIDLYIQGKLITIWITVNPSYDELIIPKKIERDGWGAPEPMVEKIGMSTDSSLGVFFNDKIIFDSRKNYYDYIDFLGVCSAHDNRLQLKFSMSVSGTGNADVHDILFINYNSEDKLFHSEIIASKYIVSECDVSRASKNKLDADMIRKYARNIYEELNSGDETTYLYTNNSLQNKLSTYEINQSRLDRLFEQIRQLKLKNEKLFLDNTEHDIIVDTSTIPEFTLVTRLENKKWQVIEVSYTEIWHSWGVLIAKNKQTGQWTSFYNIPDGGSKIPLYRPDLFKLDNNVITGEFCSVCDSGSYWGTWDYFEIELGNFTTKKIKVEDE